MKIYFCLPLVIGWIFDLLPFYTNPVGAQLSPTDCMPFSDSPNQLGEAQLTAKQPVLILSSPNFGDGNMYPANATCTRRILAPDGYKIKLEFVNATYDIETSLYSTCKYDMLEIRDGLYPFSNIMGRFCSRTARAETVLTTKNAIYLKFSSDSSIEGTGFQIRFTMLKTSRLTPSLSSTPNNVCRYRLTEEDGKLDLVNSSFSRYALRQNGKIKIDGNSNSLTECHIEIEPKIEGVTGLLIKLNFDSTHSNSLKMDMACSMHRFEFYDLGTPVIGLPAQQQPYDPVPLFRTCSPSKEDRLVVSLTNQAAIKIVALSAFLANKQLHKIQASIEYSILASADKCRVLTSNKNMTLRATKYIDYTKVGAWCSVPAILTHTVSNVCLHPKVRCNGRSNCPAYSAVSSDELNCVNISTGFINDGATFSVSLSPKQVINAVLIGAIIFTGLSICIGLVLLIIRKLNRSLGKRCNDSETDEEHCCCMGDCYYCCAYENDDESDTARITSTVRPSIVTARMTSIYRNDSSSPAFRTTAFDKDKSQLNGGKVGKRHSAGMANKNCPPLPKTSNQLITSEPVGESAKNGQILHQNLGAILSSKKYRYIKAMEVKNNEQLQLIQQGQSQDEVHKQFHLKEHTSKVPILVPPSPIKPMLPVPPITTVNDKANGSINGAETPVSDEAFLVPLTPPTPPTPFKNPPVSVTRPRGAMLNSMVASDCVDVSSAAVQGDDDNMSKSTPPLIFALSLGQTACTYSEHHEDDAERAKHNGGTTDSKGNLTTTAASAKRGISFVREQPPASLVPKSQAAFYALDQNSELKCSSV